METRETFMFKIVWNKNVYRFEDMIVCRVHGISSVDNNTCDTVDITTAKQNNNVVHLFSKKWHYNEMLSKACVMSIGYSVESS